MAKMNKGPKSKEIVEKVAPVKPVEKVSPEDKIESAMVRIPSRGVPYGTGEEVRMKLPRFKATKYMATLNGDNYEENISMMLELLLLEPKIDPWDLTIGDRYYLQLWVRMQIHGFYHITVTCPNCMYPDENHMYPLENVPGVVLNRKCLGQREEKLSKSGDIVTLGFITGKDEKEVDKRGKTKEERSILRGLLSVKKVNGKELSIEERQAWLDDLPPGDEVVFLDSWMQFTQHGPDYSNCPFTCVKCGKQARIHLPFRPELWYPTVPFRRAFGDADNGGVVQQGGNLPGDVSV
jgi:hypothetical protein